MAEPNLKEVSNAVGIWWALWMKCEARWDLFANNSLGCWAVFLTLPRIWQVGQSRKSVGLHSWRLSLGGCLCFHRPSSHGSREQLTTHVLILGGGQFSLMLSSPETGFAPFIGRGWASPWVTRSMEVADLIFIHMSCLHRDLFEKEIISK